MKFSRVCDVFGSIAEGMPLRNAAPDDLSRLRRELESAGLIVVRRQSLSDEEMQRIASGLSAGDEKPAEQRPIRLFSNLSDDRGQPVGAEGYAAEIWANPIEMPGNPRVQMMYAIETPIAGGEMWWCDAASAFAALAPERKERLKRLRFHRRHASLLARLLSAAARKPGIPVVFEEPDGQIRLSLPAAGDRVEGLTGDDSGALVSPDLDALTADRFVYEHRWHTGDLVIWDRRRFLCRREPCTGVYLMKALCFD